MYIIGTGKLKRHQKFRSSKVHVFSFLCNYSFTGRKTSLNHSDDASTYSDQENGNRDSTRKNRKKTSESRVKREPPQEKKRKSGQVRILLVQSPME